MTIRILPVLALNALFACSFLSGCASTCKKVSCHPQKVCNPACTGEKCPGPGKCGNAKPNCSCPKKK